MLTGVKVGGGRISRLEGMLISVVIPTLDEAENLGATLQQLQDSAVPLDIVVVDGGSRDATVQIARQTEGVRVELCEQPGRARQLNLGARCAEGDMLLFLHADTLVPTESLEVLAQITTGQPEVQGGSFARFFDSPLRWLRWTCLLARWRSQVWGIYLGDQGIWVRRQLFTDLGGYDESLPYAEDLDFSLRMRGKGVLKTITPAVLTSARRFDRRGGVRQTWLDMRLVLKFLQKRTQY